MSKNLVENWNQFQKGVSHLDCLFHLVVGERVKYCSCCKTDNEHNPDFTDSLQKGVLISVFEEL